MSLKGDDEKDNPKNYCGEGWVKSWLLFANILHKWPQVDEHGFNIIVSNTILFLWKIFALQLLERHCVYYIVNACMTYFEIQFCIEANVQWWNDAIEVTNEMVSVPAGCHSLALCGSLSWIGSPHVVDCYSKLFLLLPLLLYSNILFCQGWCGLPHNWCCLMYAKCSATFLLVLY